jgi:hypothetical protein
VAHDDGCRVRVSGLSGGETGAHHRGGLRRGTVQSMMQRGHRLTVVGGRRVAGGAAGAEQSTGRRRRGTPGVAAWWEEEDGEGPVRNISTFSFILIQR